MSGYIGGAMWKKFSCTDKRILSDKSSFITLQEVMQHKLVFIETQDVVETTLALDNYRRACDCGRGAVFFSVARYSL
jgi:hypothetical protein